MVQWGRVKPTAIMLVDDHPLFREGLSLALRREVDLTIVGDVGTAGEALELAARTHVDLAVIDIIMPTTSGLSLCSELFARHPSCKVLVLSAIAEPGLIADLFRAHACGYAHKGQPVAEIVEAIRQVLGGLRYIPAHVPRAAIDAALADSSEHPIARLTRREREVFELLIRGRSNDEIASVLVISVRTAETHRQRVMKKLSLHSVVQMQRLSAQYGGLA
ncbi:response regulator transcription factor [soil metagenome]